MTTVFENPCVDYDYVKSLQLMEECERFAIFARVPRPEESLNDWEEAIPKYVNLYLNAINLTWKIEKDGLWKN